MANPDYDPIKAHEYYEKHKKSKGRRSTKGMSQSQKEQWAYVKAQLSAKHKEINSKITDTAKKDRSAAIADAKEKRSEITQQVKQKVEALRNRLKNMSPEQKKLMRDRIKAMISDVKEMGKERKSKVTESSNKLKAEITDVAKTDRAYEKEQHEKRLDAAHKKIKG